VTGITKGGEPGAEVRRSVTLQPRRKEDPGAGLERAADSPKTTLSRFAECGFERLRTQDAELHDLLEREHLRQSSVLSMVAASSTADPSVIACTGTATMNVTTEGYPGARLHAGCQVVDDIERLAIERAKAAFRARYANVQPHSGTSANMIVLFGLLKAGDTLMGLDVNSGGNFTHGSKASVSGQHFRAIPYGLNSEGWIDYDQARALAREHEPKLIVCGASSYPRVIDFARFREIADEVGAYLLADISHIAGLVAAGQHPSPVDHAHFTTTSTYKQLYGPRGGLILIGRDMDTTAPDGETKLPDMIQRAVFPYLQGTPILSAVAAKARALAMVVTPEFRELALEPCHAIARATPIGLELGLAGPATADPAGETAHGCGHQGEPRFPVSKLGELDLELSFAGDGPQAEDVQNQAGAVDDLEVGVRGDVAQLAGREFGVEDQHLHIELHCPHEDFLQLSFSDDVLVVWLAASLKKAVHDLEACGVCQSLEFIEGFVRLIGFAGAHPDDDGTLGTGQPLGLG